MLSLASQRAQLCEGEESVKRFVTNFSFPVAESVSLYFKYDKQLFTIGTVNWALYLSFKQKKYLKFVSLVPNLVKLLKLK